MDICVPRASHSTCCHWSSGFTARYRPLSSKAVMWHWHRRVSYPSLISLFRNHEETLHQLWERARGSSPITFGWTSYEADLS
ncbi:hypothetical protein MLD38_038648 [Melastoma candidum]|uniref:Uncharacterized protein n=1 Tax=Melastoma candidum TaxID=119954 RepID=A0ACB9L0T3_9MYRT|nr:hypothetical protein MLD38_038648 [Melastoma candidum]